MKKRNFMLAATNLVHHNTAEKHKVAARLHGSGAPALSDDLVTNVKKYPTGTQYLDITNKVIYFRVAEAGVLADFYTEALTVHA